MRHLSFVTYSLVKATVRQKAVSTFRYAEFTFDENILVRKYMTNRKSLNFLF